EVVGPEAGVVVGHAGHREGAFSGPDGRRVVEAVGEIDHSLARPFAPARLDGLRWGVVMAVGQRPSTGADREGREPQPDGSHVPTLLPAARGARRQGVEPSHGPHRWRAARRAASSFGAAVLAGIAFAIP